MSSDHKSPAVTFGSYVIPDTVEERVDRPEYPFIQGFHAEPKPARAPLLIPIEPRPLTVALLVVLTFLLGALSMLLLSGPRAPEMAKDAAPEATATVLAAATAPAPAVVQPLSAKLEQAVLASAQGDVTRTQGGDLITPTGAMSRVGGDQLSLGEILAGLTPKPNVDGFTEQELVSRNKLETLRAGVLAGAYTVKTIKRNGRERLCLRLPHAPVSQDEAADLIEQAAARGEIELPESLSTADGSFDADTLIFNLVQTSLANDGTAEGAAAAREMSRRAFAASSAKTKKVAGERIYVVEAGDSLAYISLQFYGQPSAYDRIFQANRPALTSPDKIQIGQRLIIPG